MILINIEEADPSLERIVDWLDYYKASYKLINENQTELNFETIELSNDCFIIKTNLVDLSMCKVYWNRRSLPIKVNTHNGAVYSAHQQELNYLNGFLNRILETNAVNRYQDNFTNKLYNLYTAKKLGINIPDTIITQQKKSLINFYNEHNGRIINKAIDSVSSFAQKNGSYFTTLVEDKEIEKCEENFPPSLFQECLEKRYEIRSFYFFGNFYSMAIFSQLDELTRIDFRNYNNEKPNRCVPYKLPKYIENKLDGLMHNLSLNTGSLDLVFTESNKYYFLEVNPVGMFSPLTWPLNYSIEKNIALHLSKVAGNYEN
ncbi:MAG: grasp-with-spasm system ATP-grasp peptide maturase [Bacteroidia bacterium]|nr:grasp-with-spasm system ATP-grasp peptide maturase [Bacteroidia bacterium]